MFFGQDDQKKRKKLSECEKIICASYHLLRSLGPAHLFAFNQGTDVNSTCGKGVCQTIDFSPWIFRPGAPTPILQPLCAGCRRGVHDEGCGVHMESTYMLSHSGVGSSILGTDNAPQQLLPRPFYSALLLPLWRLLLLCFYYCCCSRFPIFYFQTPPAQDTIQSHCTTSILVVLVLLLLLPLLLTPNLLMLLLMIFFPNINALLL